MQKKFQEDQKLEDLLNVTYTIQFIYDELAAAILTKDEEKYQQALENLTLCMEVENKIYKNIPTDIEKVNRIINRINYLNRNKEKSKEIKELVMGRISTYLVMRAKLNPFLSMEPSSSFAYQENELAIYNQYSIDYSYLFNHLLNKAIEEASADITKAYLISEKYSDIIISKLLEQELLASSSKEEPILLGRERCLLFHQDPDTVSNLYYEESLSFIENSIGEFFLDEMDSCCLSEQEFMNYLFSIKVESSLYLLEKDEMEKLWNDLWNKEILSKSTEKINNLLFNIFLKVMENPQKYKSKSKTLAKN